MSHSYRFHEKMQFFSEETAISVLFNDTCYSKNEKNRKTRKFRIFSSKITETEFSKTETESETLDTVK